MNPQLAIMSSVWYTNADMPVVLWTHNVFQERQLKTRRIALQKQQGAQAIIVSEYVKVVKSFHHLHK
jgi:hypothetical protein